jgi:hypothetical protein
MRFFKYSSETHNKEEEAFFRASPHVVVLCIPYAKDPIKSFERSRRIVEYLRRSSVIVFSPILHTHPYHLACREKNPDHNDDYYSWDFGIYDGFRRPVMLFTEDWEESKGCKEEMIWANNNALPIYVVVE